MWATGVASVGVATSVVARNDAIVRFALFLLLRPYRVWTSLVAHSVLATCRVAQHVACEALEILHRSGHRHWAFEVALMFFERTIGLRVRAGLVASGSCIKCGALLLESSEDANWAGLMACDFVATLYVASLDRFHRDLLLFWEWKNVVHDVVHDILHEAPRLCHESRLCLVVKAGA